MTHPWTTLGHVCGGLSPHRASANASVLAMSGAWTTIADSTTRSLGLSPFSCPSTRSGPRTAIRMPATVDPAVSTVNPPDTGLLPGERDADTALADNRPGDVLRIDIRQEVRTMTTITAPSTGQTRRRDIRTAVVAGLV